MHKVEVAPGRVNLVGKAPGGCAGCGKGADAGRPCTSCREVHQTPGRTIHRDLGEYTRINHGAGGLGDALLGLCVVLGWRAAHPGQAVAYGVHPSTVDFLRLFDLGDVVLYRHEHDNATDKPPRAGDIPLNLGYPQECRGKALVPRWQRYAHNLGGAEPLLPVLREPARLWDLGSRWAGVVALVPFSAWHNRDWPLFSWLTLERQLSEAGYRVLILDTQAERVRSFRSEKLLGASAETVAAAVLNASCVVSNDSGLAHLAGCLGTPSVVLCGQTTGKDIFGLYPRASWLEGHLDCRGCWWQAPCEGRRCDPCCANLASISPDEVLGAVERQAIAAAADLSLLSCERLAALASLARRCAALPGAMAELGVYRGGSALALCHGAPDKTLHAFDTCGGLPDDDPEGPHREGDFACGHEEQCENLAGRRVEFHPGYFPESTWNLPRPAEGYCLVHVDADLYQSTADAIAWFWPRVVPGGAMLFDDVDHARCPGVNKALAEAGLLDRVLREGPLQGLLTKE